MKEQAKTLIQINSEKEKHINENEALKQQMKRMKEGLEAAALDKEKIKVVILFKHKNQLRYSNNFVNY